MTLKILLILAALLGSLQTFGEGGGSTGGGFKYLETKDSLPIAFDFTEIDPHYKDHYVISKQRSVVLGEIGNTLGYEIRKLTDLPAYKMVEDRLSEWQGNSPQIVRLLRQALHSLKWRFTKYAVPRAGEQYELPSNLKLRPSSKIAPVIVYTVPFGPLVSVDDWNGLGDASQAELLIHEALRHIQLAYNKRFSTAKLQKLAATMTLRKPGDIAGSLETAEFLDGALLKDIEAKKVLADADCRNQSQDDLQKIHMAQIVQSLKDDDPAIYDAVSEIGSAPMNVGEQTLMDYIAGKRRYAGAERSRLDQAIRRIHSQLKSLAGQLH